MVCMASNQVKAAQARARYDPVRERNYRRNEARRGEVLKRAQLKYFHGMTLEQLEFLWQLQAGCCYLCEKPMTRPLPGRGTGRGTDAVIEHDHGCCQGGRSCSQCKRGMAHRLCNAIIGQAGDDPGLLRLLADNLEMRMGGDRYN